MWGARSRNNAGKEAWVALQPKLREGCTATRWSPRSR
jgi:hypothetical protein